jgi:hypothetical protein
MDLLLRCAVARAHGVFRRIRLGPGVEYGRQRHRTNRLVIGGTSSGRHLIALFGERVGCPDDRIGLGNGLTVAVPLPPGFKQSCNGGATRRRRTGRAKRCSVWASRKVRWARTSRSSRLRWTRFQRAKTSRISPDVSLMAASSFSVPVAT